MASSEEDESECLIHFERIKDGLCLFTDVTYSKMVKCRNEWMRINDEEFEATIIAKRVRKYPDTLEEVEVGQTKLMFHSKCYRYFTDSTKITRAKDKKTKQKAKDQGKRKSIRLSATTTTTSTSTSAMTDGGKQALSSTSVATATFTAVLPKRCLICRKSGCIYVKDPFDRRTKMQSLSLVETVDGGRLREAAEQKNDYGILNEIKDKDMVAIEVRVHRKCVTEYTKFLKQRLSSSSSSHQQYHVSFEKLCVDVVDSKIMAEGKLFSLQNLLTCFIKIASKVENLDISNYQSSRLKNRLKLKYPDLVFYQLPDQRKSELVFSSNAGEGELYKKNVECFSDDSQMSASQTSTSQASANETENEEDPEPDNSLKFVNKAMFHRVAMAIKESLDESKGIKGLWPPSPSDFTLDNIREGIPPVLFNFLALVLGFTEELEFVKFVNVPKSNQLKVLSFAQDLIYTRTKGKTLTYKSISLAAAIKQLTGSSKLITILNHFGYCCSAITLRGYESATATRNNLNDSVLPSSILKEIFSILVYDNADFCEETLSGSGSTHVTHGICIQRKKKNTSTIFETYDTLEPISKRLRTVDTDLEELPTYYLGKKVSLSVKEVFEGDTVSIQTCPGQSFFRNLDFAYITCKLPEVLDDRILPCWTGFNQLLQSKKGMI